MSTWSSEPTPSAPPPKQSGVRTVLKYTGIPPSWLDKRPKLPSRNWLIFLSLTSSAVGLYIYDRRECKKIRQEYVDKVKHLAEVPTDPFDNPRRVTVYGAKWPGDEDHDQSLRYFRRYVKPVLVAAAVDYTLIPGKRHGDIARHVAEEVRVRRREDTGLDSDSEMTRALPTYKPLSERRKQQLAGGIVLVGRPTFKEYMAGLKRGWTDGLDKVDKEEQLARALEDDTIFDELPDEPVGLMGNEESKPGSNFPSAQSSPVFSPLQMRPPLSAPPSSQNEPSVSTPQPAPTVIPQHPPILLIPFLNYIGFKQIPLMMWDFFNQRHKVQQGAEAGYQLVMGATRPLDLPEPAIVSEFVSADGTADSTPQQHSHGDLDFDKDNESYYNKSALEIPEDIERARKNYYDALPQKLVVARELARGTREPTKEETNHPPPTEVELRAERMKKERRWRDDIEGWDIVNPAREISWDERFRHALRVFTDAPEDEKTDSS